MTMWQRLLFWLLFFVGWHFFLPELLLADEPPLLYLPFADSPINEVGPQVEAKSIKLVAGKVGNGAYFGKGAYLRLPAKGRINYRHGTVEFWVKPDWSGDDGGYHYFFAGNISDARNVNSIHLSKKNYDGGIILGQIDGRADEQGHEIGRAMAEAIVPAGNPLPASVNYWQPGEWHHLALSWDDNTQSLKLYIDGLLRATNNKVPEPAFPAAYEPYINFGSSIDETVFAEAVIDEVKIWSTPLSDLDVARSAGFTPVAEAQTGKVENNQLSIQKQYILIVFFLFILLGGLILFKHKR